MFLKKFKIILNKSCHRYLLEYHLRKTIKKNIKDNFNNLVVDFGCGNPRYKEYLPLSKWKLFDQKSSSKNVEFANEDYIPVDNADLFLCIEVIQYMNNKQVIKLGLEIERILSNKGVAIITVPYLYPCKHKEYMRLREPNNYFKLNKNLTIKYKGFGNLFSIIHDTFYQFIIYRKINFVKYIMFFIILPLKYLSLILEKKKLFQVDSGFILLVASKKNKKFL